MQELDIVITSKNIQIRTFCGTNMGWLQIHKARLVNVSEKNRIKHKNLK